MEIETIRKCQYKDCQIPEKLIVLEKDRVIFIDDKYFHFDCNVERNMLNRRKLSFDDSFSETNKLYEESKPWIQHIRTKNTLYKFIQEHYNIVMLTSGFCSKMEEIFTGKWQNLRCGIPADDLLLMWQKKVGFLDKTYAYNKKLGKDFSPIGRATYDLSILVNKYDDFLLWKAKQKVLEENNQTTEKITVINFQSLENVYKKNQSEELDISELLEEM